jgi:hypothetical protein
VGRRQINLVVTEGVIDALSAAAGGYPAAAYLPDPVTAAVLARQRRRLVIASTPTRPAEPPSTASPSPYVSTGVRPPSWSSRAATSTPTSPAPPNDRLMDARHERIALLRKLAAVNGVDIDADDGVQQLNDWFVASVKASPSNPKRLEPRWYSVVNDIGLFLGELAIARSGGKLRWEFFTAGKKDLSYHRHVIMGFNVPNPKYNADFDLLVATQGHRAVQGLEVQPDRFQRAIQDIDEKI